MIITLLRHAQVEKKYQGCYNGHLDIKLSQKGYKDAKKLKKYFQASDFDAIYSSDLIRAKETAKEFINTKNIIYTNELREKSWGRHEGLSFKEITTQDKISYINFTQWIDALDGENYQEFRKKIYNFFFNYLPSLKKTNILVITHSGVIKTFISLTNNLTLEDAFKISIPYNSNIVYDSKTNRLVINPWE